MASGLQDGGKKIKEIFQISWVLYFAKNVVFYSAIWHTLYVKTYFVMSSENGGSIQDGELKKIS
jgi:hypothetical protein